MDPVTIMVTAYLLPQASQNMHHSSNNKPVEEITEYSNFLAPP
jgi:hypothetical protein